MEEGATGKNKGEGCVWGGQQPLMHLLVDNRYEILTEQPRLYEKCMTSCSEADRRASRGSERMKCVR